MHLGEAEERGGDYFGPTVKHGGACSGGGSRRAGAHDGPGQSDSKMAGVDLGVHHLRDVDEPLRLFQVGGGRSHRCAWRISAMTNLPVRPTRLIGRDEDVARVRKLVREHRLVTVTAVGGSGKTRIAIAVGGEELPHRSGGIWFAGLGRRDEQHRGPGCD